MDFEEQLEKAERLSSPSLVGSSIRSADDSPHNNYIHPEKYRSSSKPRESVKKSSKFSNLGVSLDELMNEGALLGSEEDFERFLDKDGNVKADAKYNRRSAPSSSLDIEINAEADDEVNHEVDNTHGEKSFAVDEDVDSKANESHSLEGNEKESEHIEKPEYNVGASSFYQQTEYSTPNLSEYQLDNQIKDHSDLLTNIQSQDPHRLPKVDANDKPVLKEPSSAASDVHLYSRSIDATSELKTNGESLISMRDGIHSPYFQTDSRTRSRSRSAFGHNGVEGERSRSRSSIRPHLARGDSYKSTHDVEPLKYELPANFELNEEDEFDSERRTRQSKPTMGDSIAAAESSITKDPSLVTSGDYTNFNVDTPDPSSISNSHLLAMRSISSTNYLRSISRSRSSHPDNMENEKSEKNDANTDELVKEGALVNDDPYSTIDKLDDMVETVLHLKEPKTENEPENSDTPNLNEHHEDELEKLDEEEEEEEEKEEKEGLEYPIESNVQESEQGKKEKEVIDDSNEQVEAVEVACESSNHNETRIEESSNSDVEKKEHARQGKSEPDVDHDQVVTDDQDIIESFNDEKTKGVDDLDIDNLDVSSEEIRKHLESLPIYIFTSLAGGMQIMTRTNRLTTILKGNGINFIYRDLGTDEEAKKIWKRQSNGKALPGVVRGDELIGNYQEIEEINEEYRLQEVLYETL